MSKLIFESDCGYSIELDITDELKCAAITGNLKFLDRPVEELKGLIKQNTSSLLPKFKPPTPWYLGS
jgi:hypothetical protein